MARLRTLRVLAATVLAAAIVLAMPALPAAWGNRGHIAVARLAKSRLTPGASSAVADLLGTQSMDDFDVALWADEVRKTTRPDTFNWHFVNIPIDSAGYSADRDCKPTEKGDCVIRALARLEAVLKDAGIQKKTRREALKFVIHFVGDIHQPLHCANDNDNGGGTRTIAEIGFETNLHGAWDSGIFLASGKSVEGLVEDANEWLVTQDESDIAKGSYRSWATGSFRIARDVSYEQVKADNKISSMERKTALGFAERQIAKGGVRLAAVLNRALEQP
jgi:nuclease S1